MCANYCLADGDKGVLHKNWLTLCHDATFDRLDWQLAMLLTCNFMQVTKAKQVASLILWLMWHHDTLKVNQIFFDMLYSPAVKQNNWHTIMKANES